MGSLKYEIAHLPVDDRRLGSRCSPVMAQTVKAYRNDAIHFGEWCKRRYGARHPPDCLPHLQDYADYMELWLAELPVTPGRVQHGTRPVLIVSNDAVSHWYGRPAIRHALAVQLNMKLRAALAA